MSIRYLLCAALVLALAGSASAGLYDLGAGAVPGGMSANGTAVAFNLGGTNLFNTSAGSSVNIGAGYTTAGVTYTTFNAPGGKFVVVGNSTPGTMSTNYVYRWDGDIAGNGTWSGPLISGTARWIANAIGSEATNVYIGGNSAASQAYRYKETSGFLNGCTSLSLPSGGSSGFVYDISDQGRYMGRYTINSVRAAVATISGGSLQGLYAYPSWGPNVQGSRGWGISRDSLWGCGWSYGNEESAPGVPMGNDSGLIGVPIVWNLSLAGGTPPIMVPLMPGFSWGGLKCMNGDGTLAYGYQQSVRTTTEKGTAFVYNRLTNTSTDLAAYLTGRGVDTTGWQFTQVIDASADGNVLTGVGIFDGVEHGWVITVPEPGSMLALGVGLIGLVPVLRRRK